MWVLNGWGKAPADRSLAVAVCKPLQTRGTRNRAATVKKKGVRDRAILHRKCSELRTTSQSYVDPSRITRDHKVGPLRRLEVGKRGDKERVYVLTNGNNPGC